MSEVKENVCEEQVFNDLFDKLGAGLRNYLYYQYGDLEKSKDFMQEAFVTLWKHCADVAVPKAKTYLYTCAKRLFLNDYKHRKVVLEFEKRSTTQQDEESPEYLMRQQEFKGLLEKAIANLSEKERVVFLMAKIDNRSYREIAEVIGISEKGVEKRMGKALQKLREQLSDLRGFKF